ncbi:hypothetical protein SK128_024228 [Halocaridina rubra]|uniref:Uncharacterized protein n=1 Tax=Halocaridina rubra TaxID=373956 RepID=A0AAN8WTW7_HALRR
MPITPLPLISFISLCETSLFDALRKVHDVDLGEQTIMELDPNVLLRRYLSFLSYQLYPTYN